MTPYARCEFATTGPKGRPGSSHSRSSRICLVPPRFAWFVRTGSFPPAVNTTPHPSQPEAAMFRRKMLCVGLA